MAGDAARRLIFSFVVLRVRRPYLLRLVNVQRLLSSADADADGDVDVEVDDA